jgi:hypothetical protein
MQHAVILSGVTLRADILSGIMPRVVMPSVFILIVVALCEPIYLDINPDLGN